MKNIVLVFIGGGVGSILRYLLAKFLNTPEGNGFPYGTFIANTLGCLLIGIILGAIAKSNTLNTNHSMLLATGFCGGFTTFSTFAHENIMFLKSGNFTHFALYTIASFALGFLAVFAGLFLIK
ncbi:MAG: fluoride efflux transporter CrcB [Algicola sp.]|nr:fluoride efflux transporter CrcB [Algicola sp.]